MQKTSQLAKELLNHCQQVYKLSQGKHLNSQAWETLEKSINPLKLFLGITDFQTVIICYYIHISLTNKETTIDEIIQHFGNDMSVLPEINEAINQLIDKGLLIEKVINIAWQKKVLKAAIIHRRTLEALVNGKKRLLKQQPVSNILSLIESIVTQVELKCEREITAETLYAEAGRLLTANQHLPQVKFLKSIHLPILDQIIFLMVCADFYAGEEFCNLTYIIKNVASDENEKHRYRNNLIKGGNLLINKGLLEFDRYEFATYNFVHLTHKSSTIFFTEDSMLVNKIFRPERGVLITCETIKEEKLFYNTEESYQIELLQNALTEEKYKVLCQKLQEKQLTKGFTILLHGISGTGKTATVKQLAQKTGRHIFKIDIDKIKDKWVGGSERNIHCVFQEYNVARKYFEKDPILLFNEADAVLSRRIDVNGSVDQMNNTMQNILLQELEEFEGIFIATTNLCSNLDKAFNRRLLYKIEYRSPEPQIRLQILQQAFPDMELAFLENLNEKYPLTGGQIMNLKKKILIEQLLTSNVDIYTRLNIACAEEMYSFNNKQSQLIGFQKRA